MTTREEIELHVSATNVALTRPYLDDKQVLHPPKVTEMSLVELLRNCHPTYRAEWAHQLVKEGSITAEQAKEFTTIQKR